MRTYSTKRTEPTKERQVITLIAQGFSYIEISEETNTPVPTIKKIRKRNELLLFEVRKQNVKKEAALVVGNLQKTNKLIAQRLDRILAGKEVISDKDLVNISRAMHAQTLSAEAAEQQEITTLPKREPRPLITLSREEEAELNKAFETNDRMIIERILYQ